MRTPHLLIACLLLVLVATGCASRFTGEWLEEGEMTPAGEVVPPVRDRLMALQFGPLSAVKIGAYLNSTRTVDAETVQSGQYVVYDGGHTSQFGAMVAQWQDDHLVLTVPGGPLRRFAKVHGKSIFPPLVRPPQLSRGLDLEQYALTDPLDDVPSTP